MSRYCFATARLFLCVLVVSEFSITYSFGADGATLKWERTVAAAKKEGKLSLYLYQGDGELEAIAQVFQKQYPEVAVTTVTGRGNQPGPRIMAERRAGKYLADVYTGGPTTPYTVYYPAKVLDPVRSALAEKKK